MKRKLLGMIVAAVMILSMTSFAAEEVYPITVNDDMTFVMEKPGQNMEGEEFVLRVTGKINDDGTFVIDGLYDGDINLIEVASEEQINADAASVSLALAALEENAAGEGGGSDDGLPGTYTDGTHTLVIADDLTFTLEKTGQNMEGEEFLLLVTGVFSEDGTFVINGLYDGEINLAEVASEEQLKADYATVQAAFDGGKAGSDTADAAPAPEDAAPAQAYAGETFVVEEDTAFDSFIIEEGAEVIPADGYALIMVADGEVVRPEAGEYENVVFDLQPEDYTFGAYDETGNAEGYTRRYLYNTNPEEPVLVEAALGDVIITEDNGTLVFDGNGNNVVVKDDGIQVLSTESGDVTFKNINMEIYGTGICEINDIFGAGIAVTGADSNVVVKDANIKTVGAIMSAMNSGSGNVLVMDSQLNGYGGSEDASGLHSGILPYSPVQGAITEVPWVLGLKGTLRTINVIGDANVIYYNVKGSSNGWGVFSTDGGETFIMINTDAYYDDSEGPEFESLYGTYVLGLPTYLLGFNSDLTAAEGNTYGIVARHGFTLGESSQENLARLDELIAVETPEAEEPAEGGSGEGESAEGESGEGESAEGDSAAEPAEDESAEGDSAEGESAEGGSGEGDSAAEPAEEANLITLPSGEVIGADEAEINSAKGAWELFKENVGIENVEARRSTINARYGIMSHGARNDTFNITGTDIIAEDAAFLMKQAYMTINMDGTVTIDSPIIIHEQISDDAGISMYAYDSCWAEATHPFLYEAADNGITPASGVTANMSGMTLEGDFYNTDTDGAFLSLNFDGTETTGVISSALFLHNNASYYVVYNPDFDPAAAEGEDNMQFICVDETGAAYKTTIHFSFFGTCSYQPEYVNDNGIVTFIYDEAGTTYAPEDIAGYAIFFTDSEYCSDGEITPAETVNNPVYVTLTNGSVWNVTGTSYVAALDVDETSAVNGVITETENGFIVEPAE